MPVWLLAERVVGAGAGAELGTDVELEVEVGAVKVGKLLEILA
jgi:hypothetical protein